jgi:hypothetical protein
MSAAAERAMLGIAAELMAQGRALHLLSALATAVALGLAALGPASPTPAAQAALAISLLAGAAETVLAVRTGFDAGLFGRLAAGLDLADLDAGMRALGLMPARKTGRPVAARIAGAKRLLAWQAAVLLLQAACLGAAALPFAAGA